MNGAFKPSATVLGSIAHGLACRDRSGERLRAFRLDADDAAVDGGCDTGDQPAASDRDDDCRDVGDVLDDLEPKRSVARLEHGIVEGMDERASRLLDVCEQALVRLSRVVRGEVDLGPVAARRGDLDRVRRRPHEDHARVPASAAANAAPCAALPADQVTIPRSFSSFDRDATLFTIPRGLNEPVF